MGRCTHGYILAKGISLEDMDRLFGYCPHVRNMPLEDGKNEVEEREVVDGSVGFPVR